MISKERLEELINEGATIYYADRDVKFPIPIFLNEEDFVRENELSHEESCVRDNILLEDLYEEQKDAEWTLKYHKTRTEELDLPMWEDVKDVGFDYIFFVKKGDVDFEYYFLVGEQDKSIQIMSRQIEHIMLNYSYDIIYNKKLTKENYTEACYLCLKLFEGD